MTAINVVLQPRHKQLHVVTDGAAYTPDGTLMGYSSKQVAVAAWPGVVACRGPVIAAPMMAAGLAGYCRTFDDAVDRIVDLMPSLAQQVEIVASEVDYSAIQCVIAGWSHRRNAPEAYMIQTDDERPDMSDSEKASFASLGGINPEAYTLLKCDEMFVGPNIDREGVSRDVVRSVNYDGIDPDDSPARVIDDLKRALLVQRHTPFNSFGRVFCGVGAFGQLATVTPTAVQQQVLLEWDTDKIGEPIKPGPFPVLAPWSASMLDVSGLSRLQRERMEKKAQKQARRV